MPNAYPFAPLAALALCAACGAVGLVGSRNASGRRRWLWAAVVMWPGVFAGMLLVDEALRRTGHGGLSRAGGYVAVYCLHLTTVLGVALHARDLWRTRRRASRG